MPTERFLVDIVATIPDYLEDDIRAKCSEMDIELNVLAGIALEVFLHPEEPLYYRPRHSQVSRQVPVPDMPDQSYPIAERQPRPMKQQRPITLPGQHRRTHK